MKRLLALTLLTLALSGCDKAEQATALTGQCAKDTDCKGERIPAAPSVTYAPLPVSDAGTGPFTLQQMGTGSALNYPSRAGVVNLMAAIVEEPEYTGYVTLEKAYAFGPSRYVLVISTGEGGNACPASTYVFSFDSSAEQVDGKQQVDGCSEMVESLAEGNTLTIKKEGSASVVYNGQVK
ncbi:MULTISPECIES: hypothetical protein [unclassified Pseudomonas]|uniref:hypothetical protein n=1 Tax=unclassified Pseudomonas TaxID=196821 RepID=UPI0020982A75|nr:MULTISPECIES: hypothetical protein [unclassified Pseudomonas]MCO7519001.1 hypothetical protein [Pseudomonas sp. 1]MCO7541084.1 hypothetical protein [Pseudomonas sp. VA159-2]